MPVPGKMPSRAGAAVRLRGHPGVNVIDKRAEGWIDAVARLRQVDLDLRDDPAWIRRKHQDAVAHQHRFLDVVRDEQNAADGHPAFAPEVEQVGAQSFRREHVKRRERLVHKQHFRMDDKPPCEADALAHTARQLFGIGGFESIEAYEVYGLQGALAALLLRQALRFEAQFDILEHRKPRKKREGLKDHGDAVRRPDDRAPVNRDLTFAWGQKARDDAEQRGFARAGPAEERHNLVVVQVQIDIIEHEQIAGHAALEEVADMLDGNQRLHFGGPRCGHARRYTHVSLPVH